ELVDHGVAAQGDAVTDDAMPGDPRAVHERDVVADAAVVGDVGGDHHEHAVAQGRRGGVVAGGVDGGVVADDAVGANLDAGGNHAGLELHILRLVSETGERVHDGARPERDGPVQIDVPDQPDARPQAVAAGEDAVGADDDVVGQFGLP